MPHRCPAHGCKVENLPDRILFCKPHWNALPPHLRSPIWAHYVPGQNLTTATPAYRTALHNCMVFFKPKAPSDG